MKRARCRHIMFKSHSFHNTPAGLNGSQNGFFNTCEHAAYTIRHSTTATWRFGFGVQNFSAHRDVRTEFISVRHLRSTVSNSVHKPRSLIFIKLDKNARHCLLGHHQSPKT